MRVGKWRDRDAGGTIDPSGVFPDGSKFDGMAGLKEGVAASTARNCVGTVAEKLLMYAIGRNVQYYDAPAVRAIVRAAAAQQLHVRVARVAEVVESTPFQMRQNERPGEKGTKMIIRKKALDRRTFSAAPEPLWRCLCWMR